MRATLRLFGIVALAASTFACGESDDVELVTDAAGFSVGLIGQGDEPRVTLRDIDPLGTGDTVQLNESRMVGTGTITYLLDGGIVPLFDMSIDGTMSVEVDGRTLETQMEIHQTTRPL